MPLRTKIFLALISALSVFSLVQTITTLVNIYPVKRSSAFAFFGNKFSGIEKILQGVKYVGYYTDQDITASGPQMELLQAQHVLTPLILDPASIDHRYIIVNVSDIPAAVEKFKNLGARPYTKAVMGIFIVERPSLPL